MSVAGLELISLSKLATCRPVSANQMTVKTGKRDPFPNAYLKVCRIVSG